MIKNVLAFIGAFIIFLSILGSFGIGNFVLMYVPEKIVCNEVENE